MIQLQLFDTIPEEEADVDVRQLLREISELKQIIKEVKSSSDKVRRGMFARHGELATKFLELHERQEIIIRNLCRNTPTPIKQSTEESCQFIAM